VQVDFNSLSPQASEKRRLRDDANYIGIMMLALEGAMYLLGYLFRIVVDRFSMSMSAFLLAYAVVYSLGMAMPAILLSVAAKRRHFPFSPSQPVMPTDAFLGILSAIGICMLANIVVNYILLLFESVGVPEPQMPDYLQPTVLSLLLNVFVFAVLPALLEEMVFRGYVLRALRPYGDWMAVIASSMLFALMHGNIAQIPFAMIVGLALGWLYVMTNNIWIPVAVHFANNAFSLLIQYCSLGLDEASRGVVNAFSIFALIAIGAISLAVLIVRQSALLRRLPKLSSLSGGARAGVLATSPLFLACVLMFVLLTIADVLRSMG
jgi:membrane protease YdiL (CAAX protease family)